MSTASVAGGQIGTRHWFGGRRAGSAATFTDVSPIGEQPLAEIARGGAAEVTAAVRAAREAFGGWSATPPPHRAKILNAIADGIEKRAEELAQVETRDNGSLLRSHRRGVMPRAAHNFRFFADWLGQLDPGDLEITGHRERVSWAPRYGLAAMVFTGDRERAERVSARLVAGTVGVNCFFVRDLRAPFGGAGLSGIGREGGTWSFDFYADVKNTVFSPEGWRSDG